MVTWFHCCRACGGVESTAWSLWWSQAAHVMAIKSKNKVRDKTHAPRIHLLQQGSAFKFPSPNSPGSPLRNAIPSPPSAHLWPHRPPHLQYVSFWRTFPTHTVTSTLNILSGRGSAQPWSQHSGGEDITIAASWRMLGKEKRKEASLENALEAVECLRFIKSHPWRAHFQCSLNGTGRRRQTTQALSKCLMKADKQCFTECSVLWSKIRMFFLL